MRSITKMIILIVFAMSVFSCAGDEEKNEGSVYEVVRLSQPLSVDADWNKSVWQNVVAINISNYMGDVPGFRPHASVKMVYDNDNIYLIFQVKDQYVRCLTNVINGPVYKDSAVEFFFAPDSGMPERYFNLETNCGGTPLMQYNTVARTDSRGLEVEDIEKVEIAHTLPQIIDPEISEPVTWYMEYRIPLAMLEKYAGVTRPAAGVEWKANFYKIAENNSNPHYITWAVVDNPKPNFHLPQFFGTLRFK
jgi:hypothetical protein